MYIWRSITKLNLKLNLSLNSTSSLKSLSPARVLYFHFTTVRKFCSMILEKCLHSSCHNNNLFSITTSLNFNSGDTEITQACLLFLFGDKTRLLQNLTSHSLAWPSRRNPLQLQHQEKNGSLTFVKNELQSPSRFCCSPSCSFFSTRKRSFHSRRRGKYSTRSEA